MALFAKDFDYLLPPELIAVRAAEPRDSSRLMVIHRKTGEIEHRLFSDLPRYLCSQELLVANNTKVIRARLLGNRIDDRGATAGAVEFFLLEKPAEYEAQGPWIWEGMIKASAKAVRGFRFRVLVSADEREHAGELEGEVIRASSESPSGTVVVQLSRDPLGSAAGQLPLPQYIEKARAEQKLNVEGDSERYQTVFAREEGSAAAPTAGLHFTPELIRRLKSQGNSWAEVTLHVGLGTFRPVKTERIEDHVMHSEVYRVSENAAQAVAAARQQGRKVVAVGTTAVRTLESAWDSDTSSVIAGEGRTQIFIYPGYRWKAVDALITNFHLPQSTLLMLVSAFAGQELVRKAYETAVKEKYRFFSYGDAMLIL